MISFNKVIPLTVVSFVFLCSTTLAEPKKIESYKKIGVDIAQEIKCPDEKIRLVAATEEPIIKGVPYVKAKSIAQRIATLKAKALLSDFIKGSEFDQTSTVTDEIKSKGETGDWSQIVKSEYIGRMKITALRGIKVLEVEPDQGKTSVRVVVGVSKESIQLAGKYEVIINSPTAPDNNISTSRTLVD